VHVESFETQATELRSSITHVEERSVVIKEKEEEVQGLKEEV
jgi:hypothetical protein